jgi:hypothetical protein
MDLTSHGPQPNGAGSTILERAREGLKARRIGGATDARHARQLRHLARLNPGAGF